MNHTRTNTLFTFCLCKLLQNKKIHWVRIKYAQNTACNSQALCYLLLRMPNINSLFEKWVLEVNHPSPHPFMEKYRLLWNSSTNKVHVMLYVMLCYILYHTIKVLKALQQTKNWQCLKKMQCRIQDGSIFNISFWGSNKTWSKVCQNGNKCNSLYFGGKQSSNHDKEINTVNETPAWPNKKNASSRRHERINTNKVWWKQKKNIKNNILWVFLGTTKYQNGKSDQ